MVSHFLLHIALLIALFFCRKLLLGESSVMETTEAVDTAFPRETIRLCAKIAGNLLAPNASETYPEKMTFTIWGKPSALPKRYRTCGICESRHGGFIMKRWHMQQPLTNNWTLFSHFFLHYLKTWALASNNGFQQGLRRSYVCVPNVLPDLSHQTNNILETPSACHLRLTRPGQKTVWQEKLLF